MLSFLSGCLFVSGGATVLVLFCWIAGVKEQAGFSSEALAKHKQQR